MRRQGRAFGEWALLTAALVALVSFSAAEGWLWRPDQLVYDIGQSLGSRSVPDDLLIVAIDDESLRRIGRWPWRRAIHATLLERLTEAGTAAVGLDIILSEADGATPNDDLVMADAIRRNGRVVLPVVPHVLAPGLLADGRPIQMFRDTAAELGHIEIQLDADGIARSLYLWGGIDTPRYPQFALALLKVSRGGTPPQLLRAPGVPDEAPGQRGWRRDMWVHPLFAGPPGTYRTVSYVDVLTGAVTAEQLRGKVVLVGATATGLGDQYPTPMSRLGLPMSGVEIQATLLDALRSNATVQWLSPGQVAAATAVILLALMSGLLFLSARGGLLLSAVVGFASLVGAIVLLQWGHVWLPPVSILLGAALAYPFWSWRRLETAQRFVDAELRELHEAEPSAPLDPARMRSVDPLENRIAIIRAATMRHRAARKARDDTMRFISHDIRSPLASIVTLAEGADEASRLQHAGQYARKALGLADDFFRLAKAEVIDARKFEATDLASLAQDAADAVWPAAECKHVKVEVRDDCGREALVLGEATQLSRALTNLLDNAVKFSPESTVVRVTLRDAGDWLELDVADEGCGIAPEDVDRLFTPYGRVGRKDQPGIGLGLVIVKTVIERHGGTIAVDSTPGAGSTFRIRLPLARFGDN